MRRWIGLIGVALLSGCAAESPFVGTWLPTDPAAANRVVLTLDKDGGAFGTETPPGGKGADFSGSWTSPAVNTATLSLTSPPPPVVWVGTLHDGNQMRLMQGAREVNLKRLK
ncbi:MAG: hypothetical protein ACTHM6_04920 [Tepidisphaeraceae bacterium]